MKLILATLLLSVTFADLISNESRMNLVRFKPVGKQMKLVPGLGLRCYTSNGWRQFDEFNAEKNQSNFYNFCSSRCYAANGKYFLIIISFGANSSTLHRLPNVDFLPSTPRWCCGTTNN